MPISYAGMTAPPRACMLAGLVVRVGEARVEFGTGGETLRTLIWRLDVARKKTRTK